MVVRLGGKNGMDSKNNSERKSYIWGGKGMERLPNFPGNEWRVRLFGDFGCTGGAPKTEQV